MYAGIKNGIIADIHVFDSEISADTLNAISKINGFDEYVLKGDSMEIGSYIVDSRWVLPKPYPSWVLDEDYNWKAPVDMPVDGGPYNWDEPTLSWISFTS